MNIQIFKYLQNQLANIPARLSINVNTKPILACALNSAAVAACDAVDADDAGLSDDVVDDDA